MITKRSSANVLFSHILTQIELEFEQISGTKSLYLDLELTKSKISLIKR